MSREKDVRGRCQKGQEESWQTGQRELHGKARGQRHGQRGKEEDIKERHAADAGTRQMQALKMPVVG